MFDPVDPRQSFPALELGILQYWREEAIFHRSVHQRNGAEIFGFYDGPPFATGLPHYGHLLAGTMKDVIPRYQTMRGKYVERRFGWDCHGLPIENLIEKEHGLKSKRDIEAMGVDAFNKLCRGSVQRYTKEWRATVERIGRFVDMDWDYRTMDPDYMESIFWVFAELHRKKLIYEGYKPMHICPRCATPLSNFEVTQGYKARADQSVIMTFPLVDDPETSLLAWTTTPWSLPGNFWLAVGPEIAYAKVRSDGKTYVLAKTLVEKVFGKRGHEFIGTLTARDLVGKRYAPLFPYFVDTVLPSTSKTNTPETYGERVFKVIANDAVEVSDQEGTGIVHLTSSTGEDSYAVAKSEKVDMLPHLRIDGTFIDAVTDFVGLNAKPEGDDPMSTDKAVIENLKKRGRIFSSFTINHSYPHCWRCETPLLPFVTSSWFVRVEQIKEDILKANAATEWVPAHIRDGRFGKWLENAHDWAISRNRYWGTPLPIWRSSAAAGQAGDEEMEVLGSRDDIMARSLMRFTKVTALRHAQSQGNVTPIYQGKVPGTALTALGEKQAKEAAKLLKDQGIVVVYCSPLERTRKTAEAIAAAAGVPVVVDERLQEIVFGEYEGKTIDFSDLNLVKAKRAHKLATGQPESIYHFPGMETWDSVQVRMADFLREKLPQHRSEHIVVVTHADPLQNIRHFFTKEDPTKLSHQPYPDFADPYTFFWDHDRETELDLHKEVLDTVRWPGSGGKTAVRLMLARHGQTDWNAAERVQGGSTDMPLNDAGRNEALALGKKLKEQAFDVIVSSAMRRAAETADIVGRELGLPVDHRFELGNERNSGEWNGRTKVEVLREFPTAVEGVNLSLHYKTPPGGEPLSAFMRRQQKFADELLARYPGKRVLLVAHGGVVRALAAIAQNLPYRDAATMKVHNGDTVEVELRPPMTRVPEVLDCWFESGSMPYAQSHFPFAGKRRRTAAETPLPPGFPADFIAEGIDQTRGWFYTLMVLSAALFRKPAFENCIVNGIVLAEDGRKMSKRLKNYPEPGAVIEKFGADALRVTLMSSPAVRGEDIRFSEKAVEETLRSVVLPLWNAYGFFVTYANAAGFKPSEGGRHSANPMDRYLRAEVQDLANRMTAELDAYDLSGTCGEIHQTIDALTNWYIRLSRRRFAGKGSIDAPEAHVEDHEEGRDDALQSLYDALLTLVRLLAPFCPFITDAMYLNLVEEEHGSVHLTDWPELRALTKDEDALLRKQRLLRRIVSLGLKIRADQRVKVRQPLQQCTVAVPPSLAKGFTLGEDDVGLLRQELNVKELAFTPDPGSLGEAIAMVDARKAGPRLGARVQEVIAAGKRGDFEELPDGSLRILDEVLTPAEASVVYRGREGENVAAEDGVVVSLETAVTEALKTEGLARDLIRAVQRLRKESGLAFTDGIVLAADGLPDVLKAHGELIAQETQARLAAVDAEPHAVDIEGRAVTIRFRKE